jgi:hypothetical protein
MSHGFKARPKPRKPRRRPPDSSLGRVVFKVLRGKGEAIRLPELPGKAEDDAS